MNIAQDMMNHWQYQTSKTITDLARRLEITPATLYYWENHNEIPYRYWGAIFRVVGYDVSTKLTSRQIQEAKDRRRSGMGGGRNLGRPKKVW